jgi:hypothetical protein
LFHPREGLEFVSYGHKISKTDETTRNLYQLVDNKIVKKNNKMVNMQLTNQKLINRGNQMIMSELGYNEVKAKRL